MKIVCPQCSTAYDVTPASLGAEGRQVRCARCQNVWYAELSKSDADAATFDAPHEGGESFSEGPAGAPDFPDDDAPATPLASDSDPDRLQPDAPEASGDFSAAPEQTLRAEASATAEDALGAGPEKAAPRAEADDRPAQKSKTSAAARSADIEPLPARPPRVRKPKRHPWHARGLTAAIVVLALIDVSVILARADIVRVLPQTASLFEAIGLGVNLRDLTFKDITTKQEKHDGATILVVEGTIVATGRKTIDVPRLRFAISAANGHEIYAWTALPERTKLAPGEALPFRTRLASPPEQGQTIKIRFFNRRDIGTGLS
jgi:predicted Zn finger-like uncharacterized protein